MVIDEKELIARILSGERDLFAELVRRHQASLYQLCLAFLGDPHEAEEAAQMSFIKAYSALPRFLGHSSFRTWMTRIGINHCKDLLKSRRRAKLVSLETLLEDGTPLPNALVSHPDEVEVPSRSVPQEAFGRLSRGERAVLEKAGEHERLDYGAIGRDLGLSRDGVKGRLKRARVKVKAFLKRREVQDKRR
jgi:RNA polymerase sigma-70 factor (ECF subfamily)